MAKLNKSKRVIFPKGKQKEFLDQIKNILGFSWTDIARFLDISNRTLTDWKREKFSISLLAVKKLARKAKLPIPQNIEIKDPFWYVSLGSGGVALYKKYGRVGGDPEYRNMKWREWWNREGKYAKHPIIGVSKPIKIPKYSEKLAEFVGIILGDGGISKYQVAVTLNALDDREYGDFVVRIVKHLFGVKPSIHKKRGCNANNIVVSRRELVKFCSEKLGLKIGNKVKQQVDIPQWIIKDKKFKAACLRGLVDTDGSVFTHSYRAGGKVYSYKKISFTNLSQPLRMSVYDIMKEMGLNPRLAQNKDVRLDSQEDVKKYFWLVSSNNPKHLKRYSN